FLVITDYLTYWTPRAMHHPMLYNTFHEPRHKYIVPTPFASYAFHPVDAFSLSIPYHLFGFLFPLHRGLLLSLFLLVNPWAILV
ncbi:hypothetical protein HD554DRAFT_2007487, partial [Boletus coccyginus]